MSTFQFLYMSSILHIDGNEYHPATIAAKQLGYTKEYLLMLAKQGKIEGQKIRNKWYVYIPSAQKYFAEAQDVQEDRRRTISEARKRELKEHTGVRALRERRMHRINRRAPAIAETMAVLVIGLVIGTSSYVGMQSTQQASVSSASDAVNAFALSLYRLVVPEAVPGSELPDTENAATAPHDLGGDPEWTGALVNSPARAVQDSFSDPVEVSFDPENPSVSVVTPQFKDEMGDTYRFLLTPIEIEEQQ